MERIFGNFKNYWKLKNPRKLKNPGKLKNFLIFGLIFSSVTFWIFSGWPQIWQKPSLPPKIKITQAAPITVTVVPSDIASGDTTGEALSEITGDDSTVNPDTLSKIEAGDNTYSVDKSDVMYINMFDTSSIPPEAAITAVVLHLQYGAEDGYNGTNYVRYDNGGGLTNTTIQPSDITGWSADLTYDLYADGVDTWNDITNLDIEFTNNIPTAPKCIHFDYLWLEVTYTLTTFEQSAYRWFANLDSLDVGTPLVTQDTAATLTSSGQAFRLRLLLHIGAVDLAIRGETFKLQFAERSGTCDTAFSGETYTDVTTTTLIAYNHNSSIAWNLPISSYDNVSFDVSSEDTDPRGFAFKPDGTKMYIMGYGTDHVYQYSLSTPWDITTASYDNASTSVASEDSWATGLVFKPDGTKMYINGYDTDHVYQYSLSTPWDITTASYDNISLNVTTEDSSPEGITFKPDGTKMYLVGNNNNRIFQYSLSTAWDLSTASYDNISSGDLSGQNDTPYDVAFKPDGAKMYMLGIYLESRVYQYSLGDGSALTPNADGPTHGTDTIVNQTYEELNNFTNSVAAISVDQDGKWDFALKDNGAPANTSYCFRVVKSDGSLLDTYTVIPEITTAAANPPVVEAVDLTPDPIILTENTTTTVTCAATISDADGGNTITSATATVYRSGVGYNCSANDNNCYPNITPSATSTSGNYFYATFTVDLWFHAEPTDEGVYATAQGWNTQTWQCYVIAEDNQGATATGTDSTPPDLNTLLALTVTPTIDYGTLAAGATSSASEITTVTTTGNVPIDVELSGTDMTSTSTTSTIPVAQQECALSSVDYGSGTDLSGTPTTLELASTKPTVHPSNQSDDIYWRIGIPDDQDFATYTGTTTVSAIAD